MRESQSIVRGVVPFGYLPDKVTPHPTEAAALQEAARSIIEQNATPEQWAKEFNRRGLRTRNGRIFHGYMLTDMLKRPRYAGIVVHFGVETDEVAPWAPIFDAHTWRALQARLNRPGIAPELHHLATYLGTSIARCGVCSRHMVATLITNEGPKYRCASKGDKDRVRDGLRHPAINLAYVDDAMVKGVFDVLHQQRAPLLRGSCIGGAARYPALGRRQRRRRRGGRLAFSLVKHRLQEILKVPHLEREVGDGLRPVGSSLRS